ncbi:MAG: DUF1576 domain-containing protein [Spirochaetales bacterium]|nr:DUF1576 domain-containing protein [Spirochaetales bacterium]
MLNQDKILKIIISTIILYFIILAFAIDQTSFMGFLKLQIMPARLINDFIETAGTGPSLLNSAIVGIIAMAIIWINKVEFSGPTFAPVLTMMGFALFGKTVVNILPIIFGVYIAAKLAKKEFRQYLIIALFGTALGPIVSLIGIELGLSLFTSIFLSIIIGIATGILLPSLAIAMLHLHQGYNLYNIGLTCGFLGLFFSGILEGLGVDLTTTISWNTGNSPILISIIPTISIVFIILGLLIGKKRAITNFLKIQKLSGRLPSDFMNFNSLDGALINSGLIGIIATIYVYAVGGAFNGPVIGAILTVMGFAAFGTNLRNSWPVILGVFIAVNLFGYDLNDPNALLAIIFVTTIAPLAGEFGISIGIIAGFLHFSMVLRTGSWHGFLNLYNNGFAGGLTATLMIALIQWFKDNILNIDFFKFRK